MNAQVKPDAAARPVHKGIAAALAAAQAEMGKALKDTNNPHFKTKYADLSAVTDACMPALNKHGIAVIQPPGNDDSGNRYVKTVLIHGETGETLECSVPLIVSKNDMQGYGSAVTYARRYGLMSMAGIAPEDDDGQAAAKAPPRDEAPRREQPPREDPAAAHEREVQATVKAIQQETVLENLGAFFADLYRTRNAVATDPRVIAAKDARKAALASNADLGGDEIKY